jgi:hypothetical protein
MNTKPIFIGLMTVIALGISQKASGQGWGYCAWDYACPTIYSTESVPYFSLHPPVYYSYRVARTYGYSPFAYPPGVQTPDSWPSRPARMSNAFFLEGDESTDSSQGPHPLRIDNPFVEQDRVSGVTKPQNPTSRRPQRIYPAAMAAK